MCVSPERLLGGELVRAAESLLARMEPESLDPALCLRLAAVQTMLGLYWEMRHQHPVAADADSSVAWLSAMLASSTLPAAA